jgi:hypothetical protein
MRRLLTLVPLAALLVASCGGGGSETDGDGGGSGAAAFRQPFTDAEVYPVVANADLATGPNRFLLGLNDANDAPVGAPGVDVKVEFYDLDESATEPVTSEDLKFIWSIKPLVGLYVTNVTFQSAGEWGAEVAITGGGFDETLKTAFRVKTDSATPGIGKEPPPSENLTKDDVDKLSLITTDKTPDPDFYDLTIKQALASGRPFVVIFATPKFCQSQTCGPMLDIFQDVAKGFPKTEFIHVEPYQLPADPSNLQGVPAAIEWGLPSEPWAFVVDDKGEVVAKFEGAVAPEEIRGALEKL